MKLVQLDELIHVGGVTYDAYLLRNTDDDIVYRKTRVGAEGTEFYVKHHAAFQAHWKQISHYYFKIFRDADLDKGYFIQLRVERPFNTAPQTVELD